MYQKELEAHNEGIEDPMKMDLRGSKCEKQDVTQNRLAEATLRLKLVCRGWAKRPIL